MQLLSKILPTDFDSLLAKFVPVNLNHPVTLNEMKRFPRLRLGHWLQAADIIGGLEFLFYAVPGCWLPFVHWLWRMPGILVSGTVISREIEDQTWNSLRTTALSVREIIYAKYTAIFLYMEPHVTLVTYVRAVPVLILAIAIIGSSFVTLPRDVVHGVGVILAVLAAGTYALISPMLDVAVDGAIGTLASSFAQRRSSGVIIAVLARAIGWLLPVTFSALLQYGFPTTSLFFSGIGGVPSLTPTTMYAIAVVAMIGPAYAFLWGFEPWFSVGIVLAVILVRLGLIRALLEIAIRRTMFVEG